MKNKVLKFVILTFFVITLVACLSSCDVEEIKDEIEYYKEEFVRIYSEITGIEYELYDNFYAVTGLDDTHRKNFRIVNNLMGKPVRMIDGYMHVSDAKSIRIPKNISSISEGAFADCNIKNIKVQKGNISYESIDGNLYNKGATVLIRYASGKKDLVFNVPDGVTSIGNYAFYNCDLLAAVNLSSSVTSIGDSAFADCYLLTVVDMPNSITYIGNCSFDNCFSLAKIEIPECVATIGQYAFRNCVNVTQINFRAIAINDFSNQICAFSNTGVEGKGIEVNIGANVTKIPENIFADFAEDYKEYYQSWGLDLKTSVELSAQFSNDVKITDIIFEDNNVCKSIGDYAFYKCNTLKNVDFSNVSCLINIDNAAFAYCSSIESLVIPKSVTSISDGAFYSSDSLISIVIPDSVTIIGDKAFLDCAYFEEVYYTGNAEDWGKIIIGSDNSSLTNATIHYNYVPEE